MKRIVLVTLLLTLPTLTLLQTGCQCGIQKHDKLITLDGECDRAWADLESAYQLRMDKLPNMVKVVKARAGHEKETLEAIVQARANATKVTLTADDLTDPAKVAQFEASQQQISQSFGRLMEIHEKYPELKSDEGFSDLMNQIEGVENRIHVARKKYNEAAMNYNNELKRFGGKVLDSATGDVMFQERVYFKAQTGADKAPDLDL